MKKWDNWDLKRNIHQALSCHAVIHILSNWIASILFCLSLLFLKHKLPPHNWDNWEETCLAPFPARCPSPGASKMPATQHNAATRCARLFLGKRTNWSRCRCASWDCIHPVTQFCFSLTGGRHILTHTAPIDLLQESGSCFGRWDSVEAIEVVEVVGEGNKQTALEWIIGYIHCKWTSG